MKNSKIIATALLSMLFFIVGCGGNSESTDSKKTTKINSATVNANKPKPEGNAATIDDPKSLKGIGPVKSVTLAEIDHGMVEEGKQIFEEKCTACHKIDKKFVGPSPAGILKRRSPEWIMNMILNPEVMIKEDPLAKQVLIESNMAVMANQNLTEDEARNILEYFRTI